MHQGKDNRDERARFQRQALSVLSNWYREQKPDVGREYALWQAKYDFQPRRDTPKYVAALSGLSGRPLISILMPVYNPVPDDLRRAILSVESQIYTDWELCIADDASTDERVREILNAAAARDSRTKVIYRKRNGHISEATNSAFSIARGDYIGLLDHDDALRENALAEIALALDANPAAEIIYSDEDKISETGKRYEPHFKPDFSPDLFLSGNYLNHLIVHRSDNIRKVGGWRSAFDGAQDYDLNLRIIETIDRRNIVHIRKILYHWRAALHSMARDPNDKSYARAAALRALQDHLVRSGTEGQVEEVAGLPYFRVRRQVPQPAPLVSIIVPTRDMVSVLRTCIGSVLEKTTYRNYEILIVDNDSCEKETFAYLDEISADPRIRVVKYPGPFNYSAMNNSAMREVRGSLVCLLNNDTEVIEPGWLDEMVSQAVRPEIGCVGAKLIYADETIQHAGVVIHPSGTAVHAHSRSPREAHGYFGRLYVCQNYSAVTAACLVMRTDLFHEVGGFDEEHLAVAFNDVDLCLKVREAGYLNLYTPFAVLYHHESLSRGYDVTPEKRERALKEVSALHRRWRGKLQHDPYYSPHFTADLGDFSIRVS
jgi:GT2 family glycosyltransferase